MNKKCRFLILGVGNPVAKNLIRLLSQSEGVNQVIGVSRFPNEHSDLEEHCVSIIAFDSLKRDGLRFEFDYVVSFLPLDQLSLELNIDKLSQRFVVVSSASRFVKQGSKLQPDISLVNSLISNERRIRAEFGSSRVNFVYPTIIIGRDSKFSAALKRVNRACGFLPVLSCWTGERAPISSQVLAEVLRDMLVSCNNLYPYRDIVVRGAESTTFKQMILEWSTLNQVRTVEIYLPISVLSFIATIAKILKLKQNFITWIIHGSWNLMPVKVNATIVSCEEH